MLWEEPCELKEGIESFGCVAGFCLGRNGWEQAVGRTLDLTVEMSRKERLLSRLPLASSKMVWHMEQGGSFVVNTVVLCSWLDSIILKAFFNLNDPMIL